MFNLEIRSAIKEAGVYGYEVAAALNISETSFSRIMARRELTEEEKKTVLAHIRAISEKKSEVLNENSN